MQQMCIECLLIHTILDLGNAVAKKPDKTPFFSPMKFRLYKEKALNKQLNKKT